MAAPKDEPMAHISWPTREGKGPKLGGAYKALGLGKRVRLVLEGVCRAFSLADYGVSLDLKVKTITVERVGDADDDRDEGPSMVEQLAKVAARRRRE